MQKVARVTGPRKRRGKEQEKSLKRAMEKKNKSKFWLMHMHQIKIFHISVWSKNSFFSETKAHLRLWQLKN